MAPLQNCKKHGEPRQVRTIFRRRAGLYLWPCRRGALRRSESSRDLQTPARSHRNRFRPMRSRWSTPASAKRNRRSSLAGPGQGRARPISHLRRKPIRISKSARWLSARYAAEIRRRPGSDGRCLLAKTYRSFIQSFRADAATKAALWEKGHTLVCGLLGQSARLSCFAVEAAAVTPQTSSPGHPASRCSSRRFRRDFADRSR